jgi:hypothetical protein
VILKDWVHAIIIPENHREEFTAHIPSDLQDNVYYVTNNCKDIWEWSKMVYEFANKI